MHTQTDVFRYSPVHEQLRQSVQHVLMIHLSFGMDRQTFPGVLIQEGQQPKGPSIMGSLMYEVIALYIEWCSRGRVFAPARRQ